MTAYSTTPPYSDRGAEESEGEMMSRGEPSSESDQRHYQKVNQVIQNFFTKSALAVISSRVSLPPGYNKDGKLKHNKWVCHL
jgi:autophagy-related protein 13